ncbi:hypothetical protein Syun_004445 [Stephania yunnanensis]|uniref:MADS-box domain-containing protein n=1 Tax=Stephania yunnanensis TaxID=152371 RepID=A0AAP0L340_9MAGN
MGRKKIEIQKIECSKGRQVCFAKRRKGLFKKCLKWSTLSGNDLLVVAFSPAGRPFTLCASSSAASPDSILNRLSPMIPSSSSDLDFPITPPLDHYSNSTRTAEEVEETRLNQEGFNSDSLDFEIHQVLHTPELRSNYDMIYQQFSALMDTSVNPGNRLANAAQEEWLGWINDGF